MDEISAENMLGRYYLLSMLGKGGMGEVWLAEDPLLRRQVAIKRLVPHHSDDQQYIQRFEREARAAAALHHPHILPLHDYGQQRLSDGRLAAYIVMSYVANGSLEERLASVEDEGHLLPSEEALAYLTQAAQAIDYAHEQGVLHRDIKPGNMLLREDRTLLLADFGLARLADDEDNKLTQTGMPIGTPRYMAPEQARGEAIAASDIYSLAILAYRCFTGHHPFNADTTYALIIQQVTAQPPAPHQFNSALSPTFEEALLRGLAKDPAQRPSTAREFIWQLRQGLAVHTPATTKDLAPTEETDPVSTVPTPDQPRTLPRRTFILAGSALIGGAGITALVLSTFGHTLFAPAGTKSDKHPAPAAIQKSANPIPVQIQAILSKPVIQLAWSPTKNILAACGQDGQCVLWDLQTDQADVPLLARHTLSTNGSNPLSMAWSPDGSMLAVSNADAGSTNPYAVLVYKSDLSNLASGFSNSTITSQQQNRGLSWSPGRVLIVLNSVSNNLYQTSLSVYDPAQPAQTLQPALINGMPASFTIETLPTALAPDGSTLALSIGTADQTQGVLVGKVSVTGTQVQWQPDPLLPTNHEVTNIAWSPGGHYLAGILPQDIRQILHVWDATQHYQPLKLALSLTNSAESLSCIAWSPTRQFQLAAGSSSGKVYLWNLGASGASLVRTLPGIAGNVTALSWSHDGQRLAASYDDNLDSILIWRLG